jgi:hypothetical protein
MQPTDESGRPLTNDEGRRIVAILDPGYLLVDLELEDDELVVEHRFDGSGIDPSGDLFWALGGQFIPRVSPFRMLHRLNPPGRDVVLFEFGLYTVEFAINSKPVGTVQFTVDKRF